MTGPFDLALAGRTSLLERDDGQVSDLPVHRWHNDPDDGDALLVDRCLGSTLDVGCGPGRLTSALVRRGVTALGIDMSATAIRLTRRRGGIAVLRDVFDRIPGEGTWQHVLLADGNIGIGGDPARLLHRMHALLDSGGSAVIEVSPPGTGLRRCLARLRSGPWFPWAELDIESIVDLAATAGFTPSWTGSSGPRWFAELHRT